MSQRIILRKKGLGSKQPDNFDKFVEGMVLSDAIYCEGGKDIYNRFTGNKWVYHPGGMKVPAKVVFDALREKDDELADWFTGAIFASPENFISFIFMTGEYNVLAEVAVNPSKDPTMIVEHATLPADVFLSA